MAQKNIDQVEGATEEASAEPTLDKTAEHEVTDNNSILSGTIHAEINNELTTMMRYALLKGKIIPDGFSDLVNSENIGDKIKAHNMLAATVAPATPQSIRYLSQFINLSETDIKTLASIPLIKRLLVIAVLSLLVTIGISLSPDINEKSMSASLLDSSGIELLVNLIFVCASAILGVMFYLLKDIANQVKTCTLIQEDVLETNTLIIIGTISGFIISEIFIINVSDISDSIEIQKMAIALLGGFSSDAIFSVLQGFVNKIKVLLTPSGAS